MNLMELVATLRLDTSGYNEGMEEAESTASSAGSAIGSAFKKLAGAVAIKKIADSFGNLVKSSVSSYSQYEQMVGGVETLFKKSSGTVMQYAQNAYQTAGVSANTYMETITSFSASLLQGLGGDTEKAAKLGNQAVVDMADNANKMGTSMDTIIQTYQSLSRGNYAMLDNLKLGYGGTKAELERLVEDASKLTGEALDPTKFSDVITAIHAVQENLGITGTTSEEAATTIEGSVNSMKAAWQNLLTGFADGDQDLGGLIDKLIDSVANVSQNIIPRIAETIPRIFEGIGYAVTEYGPQLLEAGGNLLLSLAEGFRDNFPRMVEQLPELIGQLASWIAGNGPEMLALGGQIVLAIGEGLVNAAGELLTYLGDMLATAGEGLKDFDFGDVVGSLFVGLGSAILTYAPQVGEWIGSLFSTAGQAASEKLQEIGSIMVSTLRERGGAAIEGLAGALSGGYDAVVSAARSIKNGIVNAVESLPERLRNLASTAVQRIKSTFSAGGWYSVGSNIINGIVSGVTGAASSLYSTLKNLASAALGAAKSALGINSPSKVFRDVVGVSIPEGIAVGIERGKHFVDDAMDYVTPEPQSALSTFSSASYGDGTDVGGIITLLRQYLPYLANNTQIVMDSGAVVGSLAPKMDKALGKINVNRMREA